MITENAITSLVRPAVLGRGRVLARRQGHIWHRACVYEESYTLIEAYVDSSSGYRDSYLVSAMLDEVADQLVTYDCDCPAASRFAGPCKHVVALVLDYVDNPLGYRGFDEKKHALTTPAIRRVLDQYGSRNVARIAVRQTVAPGTVRILPMLNLTQEAPLLSLRVQGSANAYVVKSIGDFVDRIDAREYFEYGKRLAFTHERDAFVPEDRPLVTFLEDCVQNRRTFAVQGYGRYAYGGRSNPTSVGRDLYLSVPEFDQLMELRMGRQVQVTMAWGQPRRVEVDLSLAVEEGDPSLAIEIKAQGNGYELRLGDDWEGEILTSPRHLYVMDKRRILRCSDGFRRAEPFLSACYGSGDESLTMTEEDMRRFAALVLPKIDDVIDVEAPPEVDAMRPEPLKVLFYLDRDGRTVTCDAVATYGDQRLPLLTRPGEQARGKDVMLVRDYEGEHAAREVVRRYFVPQKDSRLLTTKTDADSVARVVFEGVGELARVGEVMATEAFSRLARTSQPRVNVGVSVRSGLIDLSVSAEDLPMRELSALLASYRQRKRYHRLRDGSFVKLAETDLDEAALLVDELGVTARQLGTGHVAIPSYKAFLLDTLVPDDEKDDSFMDYVEGFRTVDPSEFEVPATLRHTLRPYQEEGFRWLCALERMGFGGVLADEMGLGKSLQFISFVLAHHDDGSAIVGPTLIVCPASLVYNWLAEFGKFAPSIDVVAVAGTAEERRALRGETHEVFVTSYDLVRRDVEEWAKIPLWCAVLDEAQYIKNQQTLAAQATKALDARVRFALTGTPIENRLSEMWSIFDFLMPGLLGSYERFRARYEEPIVNGDDEVAVRLRDAVRPFVLRRLKRDVLDDLPEKLERIVSCRMGPEQRRLYVARQQSLRASLTGTSDGDFATGKLQVLAELTRLRQICCDPSLIYENYKGRSAKIDTIAQLVDSAVNGGEKVLVFSQFTSFLALIAQRLKRDGLRFYEITGATPKRRRVELVDAFNADDVPVFLVSLKAGGTGLNLVGANVVIHADPWWNAAAQDQATDRAHRIGQTRDVSVLKVICTDSIEERILVLQEAKANLADTVVGEGGGTVTLASLRREDLLDLLGD